MPYTKTKSMSAYGMIRSLTSNSGVPDFQALNTPVTNTYTIVPHQVVVNFQSISKPPNKIITAIFAFEYSLKMLGYRRIKLFYSETMDVLGYAIPKVAAFLGFWCWIWKHPKYLGALTILRVLVMFDNKEFRDPLDHCSRHVKIFWVQHLSCIV